MTTISTRPPRQGSQDYGLLLGGLQQTALEQLGAALEASLQRVDDYLFDLSSKDQSSDTELWTLRELRRARGQIEQRFEQSLVAGFRVLQTLARKPETTVLSLLSEDALEQQLAGEQMAESLVRQHAPALEVLERRLETLLQRPHPLARNENPVAPSSLADALREALAAMEMSTRVHIILFKFFERELGPALRHLYERMNASLIAAGILPRLLPARAEVSPAQQQVAQVTRQVATPETPAMRWAAAAEAAANAPAAAPDYVMQGPADDDTLFSNLVGLLQSWRRDAVPGDASARSEPGRALHVAEMLSVLSLMQSDPPQSLDRALHDQGQSLAEQLRREVLAGARRMGIGGDDLGLSNTHQDAVDLVGMLFDVLLDDRDFEPGVRSKISRMLVPYVKVAVKDRRMFLYKKHPARRLLNAVAEACEGNRGEAPQERELLHHVDGMIDRLVAEYNEDLAIFETLEQELRAFMGQQRKRIELAERRATEAQRGRERLEQARLEASADLARRRGDRVLPQALDEFVSQYARHHLTQVILREGRESPRYGEALYAIAGLLATYDQAELGDAPEPLHERARAKLQAILASSGCVGDAAEHALQTLQVTLERVAAGDDSAANAVHLPEPIAVAEPSHATESALAVVGGISELDYVPAVAERLRQLEIGTWVQLTSASGRSELAKMSWISPISSRFLFVNRRGIRVLVASAEELAAMAKLGQFQLREADNAFDDAMRQILGRLQTTAPVAQTA
jgi:hypothetical protein